MTGESILLICKTKVYPNILYYLSIWGFTNKVHLSKVLVSHKKLLRIINGVYIREHTSPIFNILQLFKFSTWSMNMCSIFVYKVLMNPPDNKFFQNQNAMYITRNYSSQNFLTPFIGTYSSMNSICYTGPKHWDSSPERMKSARSYTSFKRQLKSIFSRLRGD